MKKISTLILIVLISLSLISCKAEEEPIVTTVKILTVMEDPDILFIKELKDDGILSYMGTREASLSELKDGNSVGIKMEDISIGDRALVTIKKGSKYDPDKMVLTDLKLIRNKKQEMIG